MMLSNWSRQRRILIIFGFLLVGYGLSACTRVLVPVETIVIASPTAIFEPTEEATSTTQSDSSAPSYAVVWVNHEETLAVRKPAGISGTVVAELMYYQRGIQLTGSSTQLGSSTWVEIKTRGGGIGWVNAWNLTEEVSRSEFCQDTRVIALLEKFEQALREHNGEILSDLVHPIRGLTLRHDWWNPDVQFLPSSVERIFIDRNEVDWGVLSGSQFHIRGTFSEILLPLLEDVFIDSSAYYCNRMIAGTTTKEALWPREFRNMNFYTVHRPSPEGGNRFDWRTWALGFESINGQPYLSVLIQYRGDI